MDEHLLIALQRQRDYQRDRADRAEDRIREAIRWCELIAGSKSPGAGTAAQILGILKGEKPKEGASEKNQPLSLSS